MKQTQNALKFLLAQYRAIYKHAYVKGLATAVLLTAGLAAGQAQAAENNFYLYNNSQSWIEKTHGTDYLKSYPNKAAGAAEEVNANDSFDSDTVAGSVSNGHLTIGAEGTSGVDLTTVKADAYGGYISITEAPSISNAVADNNVLTLRSGGTVSGSVYGAYVTIDNGNATATDNKVNISGSATLSSTSGVVYGAHINTDGGIARADNNSVTITADTFSMSGTDVIGAMVEGSDGASATGNTVTISGTGTTPLALSIKHIRGADVQNGKYDFGSDIRAIDNSVDGRDLRWSHQQRWQHDRWQQQRCC